MQAIDYSKISITAKLVAHFRQYSDIPFAQDVASYVKSDEALSEISSKLPIDAGTQQQMIEQSKVYAPLLEARYKSIVKAIQRSGINQVLELASGYSLRGLAMATHNPDIFYIESDLANINDEKNKLIAALRKKHALSDFSNHFVVTANALERTELESATARLNHHQPLLIVNEGLIPYLSTDERDLLADNLRYLLTQFAGGAWITPDLTTRNSADHASGCSEYVKRFRKAVLGVTERQLHEAAFESEQSIKDFIHDHGFTGTSAYQLDEITNLVSPERLSLSNQVIERLKPHMRIWNLSLE